MVYLLLLTSNHLIDLPTALWFVSSRQGTRRGRVAHSGRFQQQITQLEQGPMTQRAQPLPHRIQRARRVKTDYEEEEETLRPSFKQLMDEEEEICERAARNVQNGRSILIDWRTNSNFRVGVPPVLRGSTEASSKGDTIGQKVDRLNRMLRQKKASYLQSSSERRQSLAFFRDKTAKKREAIAFLDMKKNRRKRRQTLEECQQRLLIRSSNSTFTMEQLKEDFRAIRDSLSRRKLPRKRSLVDSRYAL